MFVLIFHAIAPMSHERLGPLRDADAAETRSVGPVSNRSYEFRSNAGRDVDTPFET